MKYGNRSVWKRVMKSRITLVIALVVFVFMAKAAWDVYWKESVSSNRLAGAQAALDQLRNRNADLSRKIAFLSTEQGVKSEIRAKFRATESGESVAVIVGDSEPRVITEAPATVELPWWRKMLRMFGL